MRAKYATVKIPQELASKLDEFVVDMGYRSRAEIVNDAIRRFIDERKRLDISTSHQSSQQEPLPSSEPQIKSKQQKPSPQFVLAR